jgi:hypothetical protein
MAPWYGMAAGIGVIWFLCNIGFRFLFFFSVSSLSFIPFCNQSTAGMDHTDSEHRVTWI